MLLVQLLSGHLKGELAGQGGSTWQRDGSPTQEPSEQRNGLRGSQVMLGEHPLGPVGSARHDPLLHWNGVLIGHPFFALQSDQLDLQLKSGQTKLVDGQKFLAPKQLLSADSGKSGSAFQKGLQTLSGQKYSPSGQLGTVGQIAPLAIQSPVGQRYGALAVQLLGRTVKLYIVWQTVWLAAQSPVSEHLVLANVGQPLGCGQ